MNKPLVRAVCAILSAVAAIAYVGDVVNYPGKSDHGGQKLRTLTYIEVVDVPPSERPISAIAA